MARIIELSTRYGRYGYRRITSQRAIDQLFHLFIFKGIPEHIRSDNGPEFTAKVIRDWLRHGGRSTIRFVLVVLYAIAHLLQRQ